MKKRFEILQESIFSQIDPILRRLLYSIEQELSLSSATATATATTIRRPSTSAAGLVDDNDNDNDNDNSVHNEKKEQGETRHSVRWQKLCRDVLFLQNLQAELFQTLQSELEAIVTRIALVPSFTLSRDEVRPRKEKHCDCGGVDHVDDHGDVAIVIRETIYQMQKYILLPILLKLQNPFSHLYVNRNERHGSGLQLDIDTTTDDIDTDTNTFTDTDTDEDTDTNLDANRETNESGNGVLPSNIMLVIRNNGRKSLESATFCLKIVFQILLPLSLSSSSSSGINNDHDMGDSMSCGMSGSPTEGTNTNVHVELKVQSMVALWTSLSFMVKEYLACPSGVDSFDSNHSVCKSSLDKGEECMYLLLECMEVLCCPPGTSKGILITNTTRKQKGENPSIVVPDEVMLQYQGFVSRLLSCMDGRFIVLLVQCAVSILDNNGSSVPIQERNRYVIEHNNDGTVPVSAGNSHYDMYERKSWDGKHLDMKGNIKLKVQVLSFMRVLMVMGTSDAFNAPKLHNLQVIEEEQSVAMTNLWRSVFPGVFKSLFRETLLHLRFTTSQSSSKLAIDFLQTLSVLMNRTLSITTTHETIHNMPYQDVFLRGDINSSIESKGHTSKINDTALRKFLDNVHEFLPRPLFMILKLLPLQKTTSVKIAGARNFCRSILLESRESWAMYVPIDEGGVGVEYNDEKLDVTSVAFETLITMAVDHDETLAKECNIVLRDYRNSLGENEWNKIARNVVIPRVVNLIQTLPSYAKSGRESDLSSNMQLVSGYLLSFAEDESSDGHSDTISKTMLSKFLFQKLVSNKIVRQCLVDIFTMDNANSGVSKIIENHGKECGSFRIPFKYLHGSTEIIARDLLRNMRKVLGYRRAFSLAEDCIAEFYAALSDRINHNRSLMDTEQSRFVEKHFGTIVIAKELLAVADPISNKKHRRLLNSLASTLIPMIVSEIMWQLPSVSLTLIHGLDTQLSSLTDAEISSDLMISQLIRIKDVSVSSEAMNGNSTVTICLMDLIAKLATTLGPDFIKFVPLILYPIVQKISDLNSRSVQDAAGVTLIKISDATCHFSVQGMLLSNFRYLIETLTTELNNPYVTDHDLRSQAICFHSLHGMIDLILRSTDDTLFDEDIEDRVMLLTDMQRSIVSWFDRQFSRNAQELLSNIAIPLSLSNVSSSILRFLNRCMSSYLPIAPSEVSTSLEQFSWEDLIVEFQTLPIDIGESQHEAIAAMEGSQTTSPIPVSSHVLEKLTVDIEQSLLVNATFITLPNVKLQKKACELFLAAFELLFSIQQLAKLGDKVGNSENSAGNPLLQSVSKHWPTLEIRFQRAVVDFTRHACEKHESTPKRHSGALLSGLLDIIKCLNIMCGDFIACRFNSSIWPQMSKILTFLLPPNHDKIAPTYSETDSSILISLLSCISQTFSAVTCGRVLANIAPVIGTILLPFLSCGGKIGEAAMCAIQEILRIDCDCLWRPLLSLSRSKFPERPLLQIAQQHGPKCTELSLQGRDSRLLTERLDYLLVFVHSLPEQQL